MDDDEDDPRYPSLINNPRLDQILVFVVQPLPHLNLLDICLEYKQMYLLHHHW